MRNSQNLWKGPPPETTCRFKRHSVDHFASSYHHGELHCPREVFTDGSRTSRTSQSGAGVVYFDDADQRWQCRGYALGPLPGEDGARDAEKLAIVYALDLAVSNLWYREIDALVIKTDCKRAIGDIAWQYWEINGVDSGHHLDREIVALIRQLDGQGIVVKMDNVERRTCRGTAMADDIANDGRWASEQGNESWTHFCRPV